MGAAHRDPMALVVAVAWMISIYRVYCRQVPAKSSLRGHLQALCTSSSSQKVVSLHSSADLHPALPMLTTLAAGSSMAFSQRAL